MREKAWFGRKMRDSDWSTPTGQSEFPLSFKAKHAHIRTCIHPRKPKPRPCVIVLLGRAVKDDVLSIAISLVYLGEWTPSYRRNPNPSLHVSPTPVARLPLAKLKSAPTAKSPGG